MAPAPMLTKGYAEISFGRVNAKQSQKINWRQLIFWNSITTSKIWVKDAI